MNAQQSWLITGGAGYIGSHVVDSFLASGKEVIIYDSLSHGLESRVDYLRQKHGKDVPLIIADIRDSEAFSRALEQSRPLGVIHLAAVKSVGESMENSDKYFDINLNATSQMLETMSAHGISHFIFSSTAAVYGSPNHSIPVKENDIKAPISPYGQSKYEAEQVVNNFLTIHQNRGTSLRFFNAVGRSAPELSDNSIENLLPIVMNKLKSGQNPEIFGDDYPTPDGTCIRDYVDVRDIANVHLAAADYPEALPLALNVGTGSGRSVREVITLLSAAMDRTSINAVVTNRRSGDPALLCADVSLMEETLGYKTQYSLEASIASLV
jgi:UDP-glucose 4-epimerase